MLEPQWIRTYIYIYMCVCIYIYIYLYIVRTTIWNTLIQHTGLQTKIFTRTHCQRSSTTPCVRVVGKPLFADLPVTKMFSISASMDLLLNIHVFAMSMAVHSMDTRWTLDGHSTDTTIDTTIDTCKTARLLRFTMVKRKIFYILIPFYHDA